MYVPRDVVIYEYVPTYSRQEPSRVIRARQRQILWRLFLNIAVIKDLPREMKARLSNRVCLLAAMAHGCQQTKREKKRAGGCGRQQTDLV